MKKNLMYLLLFILVIFAALKGVDALEDTMLVKYIPVPDAYIWKRDTTGHRTTTSQHIYVMARASDHQIVYCIEPGTAIDETHNYTGYENNFATYASMTPEQWERVMLLAYYGYNYHDGVTDHSDVKWYAVAQYMIWKTVPRDYDIYFSTSVYKNERLDDKYAAEQAEMERLLQNHYKTPQFDSGKLLLGEKVTLSDNNNVLGHYDLKTKTNTVSKNGNALEINATSLGKIEFQMQKTDSIYSHTPIVFVNSETQDVMEVGSYNPISSQYSLEVVAGKVKLLKLDEDSKVCNPKLAGAIYGVYKKDGNLVTQLTINNQCMAESDAILGIGDYYIQELQAPNGYEMDSQTYPFTMTHENVNQVKEITVYDKEEKGTIKIKKYDAETKTCTPTGASKLKGAVYGIYQNETLIQKITIQDNCEGVSTDIPLGDYYIQEIEAPYGYELDTHKYNFSLNSENYTKIQEFTMYDIPHKGKVKLIKYDAETKSCTPTGASELKGAVYGIYQNEQLIQKVTIQDNCASVSTEIPLGDYYIKEIEAPYGYELDSQKYEFSLTDDNYTIVQEFTMYDKPHKGKVKLIKYDAETKTCTPTGASKLKGAIYGIFQNETLIQRITILDNCEGISTEIPLGDYYIKEVEAPYGYELDTQKYEFSLTDDNYTIVQELTMYDKPHKGKVKIIKYDSETKTCTPTGASKLKGAVYGIFQNKTLIQKVTIQDLCEGISTEIPLGDYYIQEIEAPYGYDLDPQKYEFSLTDDNYTIVQEFTMYDKPHKGKIKLIKYDSESKSCHSTGSSTLSGAIYGIYQNEQLIQKVTIQDNCEGISTDIPLGDYYIQEIEAPYGYELDPQKYEFSLTDDNYTIVQEFTMYDTPHKGKVKIIKYDAETKSCTPTGAAKLEGAIYGIFQNETLIQKITIQDNCEGISTTLPLGDYYIQEIEAPYGYELDPQKYNFSLTDDTYENGISITVYDHLKKKKIQIIKKENGTEKRVNISGIAFKIYDLIENKYVCETEDCIYYTNEFGEFTTEGLPYSKYQLEEVDQPILGYLWNPVPLEFEIDEESSDLIVLSFYNETVVGGIKIEKRNERGEPLEGIEFEITANEDIYDASHEILYHAGDVVEVLTTNQDGFTSIKGIPLGSYLVKEIKTQDGYLLTETVFEVNLTYQDEFTPVVYDTLKVVNYSIPKTKQDSLSMLLLIPMCLGGYFLYDKKNTWNATTL